MSDKIVFLDIDGVLNRTKQSDDLYYDTFENNELPLNLDLVDNLKTLIESDENIKIVWSSDWGIFNELKWKKWLNPRIWLESQFWLKDKIIGITPRKMSSEHYHNIKWWLDEHAEIKRYVILEDSYFPENWFGLEKHLIQIDSSKGFDKNELLKAMFILKN